MELPSSTHTSPCSLQNHFVPSSSPPNTLLFFLLFTCQVVAAKLLTNGLDWESLGKGMHIHINFGYFNTCSSTGLLMGFVSVSQANQVNPSVETPGSQTWTIFVVFLYFMLPGWSWAQTFSSMCLFLCKSYAFTL